MYQLDGRTGSLHFLSTRTNPSPVLTLPEPNDEYCLVRMHRRRLLQRRGGYCFFRRPNKIAHDVIPLIQEIER